MAPRKILITGATGKQAAQKLASNAKVTLIEGDLNDCSAIFEQGGSVWGVFSVQVPYMAQGKGAPKTIEEDQGMALVDAALANGVSHFVYSSVGSGGPNVEEEEEKLNLKVPHFVSKYIVEKHLKEKAEGSQMTYTILQPVAFLENFTPGIQGKIFAAISFSNPEGELKNKSITLVGDDLTASEANDSFFKALHRPMPRTYGFLVSIMMYMVTEVGTMLRWFQQIGYKGDIAECKRINPEMLDLATWLKTEGPYENWGAK